MADSFIDYIRRKRGYGGAVSQQEREAVSAAPSGGWIDPRSGLGSDRALGSLGYSGASSGGAGSAGAAAAANAARAGGGAGYTGGGPTGGPVSRSTAGISSGGPPGRPGIGSDVVAGGGPYAGGMYSGGIYSQPRSVPTTTFQAVPDTIPSSIAGRTSSGYGDYGGGNFVRNETRIPTGSGLTRASSGLGDLGGRDTRVSELGDYLGETPQATTGTHGARPATLGGRYVPPARDAPGSGGAASRAGIPGTAAFNTLADAISKAEGTTKYGYNTAYGGGFGAGGKPFTGMTLSEMRDHMKEVRRTGDGNAPMGKFQINQATMDRHAKLLGMDPETTYFNEDTQNKLMMSIAKVQGLKPEVWAGFANHPKEFAVAKKAYGMLKGLPAPPGITSTTQAFYRGRAPAPAVGAGGIGSDYGASASRGMGSSYGSGGYKGGTYGGAGGSSISQGVGGAYKNR